MILDLLDLWPVVDGAAAEPDTTTSQDAHAERSWKDWEARVPITLALKDEQLNVILGATCAQECWNKSSVWHEGRDKGHIGRSLFRRYSGIGLARFVVCQSGPVGQESKAREEREGGLGHLPAWFEVQWAGLEGKRR